jgi:hypothetical protein
MSAPRATLVTRLAGGFMMRRHAAGWLTLAIWSVGACGCGSPYTANATGSLEEVTLKGTIRVRGKPVTNGVVSFRSSNVKRPTAQTKEVPISKDGTYTVTTLVGQNFVEVSCKETLGPKNRDLIENEQMIKIESGQSALDITIPPQTAPTAK